jgi:hypothetical protein
MLIGQYAESTNYRQAIACVSRRFQYGTDQTLAYAELGIKAVLRYERVDGLQYANEECNPLQHLYKLVNGIFARTTR